VATSLRHLEALLRCAEVGRSLVAGDYKINTAAGEVVVPDSFRKHRLTGSPFHIRGAWRPVCVGRRGDKLGKDRSLITRKLHSQCLTPMVA